MTIWHVDSNTVGGTQLGNNWANACISLSQLMGLASHPASGDTIAIGSTSAESYSTNTTITFGASTNSAMFIYSATNTGGTNTFNIATDVAVGAAIALAGTAAIALTLHECIYMYGVTFNLASSSGTAGLVTGAASTNNVYESCTFNLQAAGGGLINFNDGGGTTNEFWNCNFSAAATASGINLRGRFIWKGGQVNAGPGSVVPANLIQGQTNPGEVRIEGVDLSALSGKQMASAIGPIMFKDCKFPASYTLGPTALTTEVYATRCDSSATVNRFDAIKESGAETIESNITRVGSQAVDFNGNQWTKKISTNANAKFINPYMAETVSPLNLLTGSTRTVTVYGIWDAGAPSTPPNIDDIWIQVGYPEDSGDPMAGFVTSTKSNPLVVSSPGTLDTSTWNNIGSFTNPSPFSMTAVLTALLKGPLTVKVKAAKASTVFYIDPVPVLS